MDGSFPTAADYASAAASDANHAAKEVARVALAAHTRIDSLEYRVKVLEVRLETLVRLLETQRKR